MRLNFRFIGVLLAGLLAMGQAPMPGRASAGGAVLVRAEFKAFTSLRVSSSVLQFDVVDPQNPPSAVVDFHASARTARDGEVVLTVESIGDVQSPEHGPAARNLTVAYQGEGDTSGTLAQPGPHIAGRWTGSGVRDGHVTFALHGAQASGTYSLAVKFVLTAP